MCLTVPRMVEKVEGTRALLQDGRWVSLALVGTIKSGDMLLVNANMAIEKVAKRKVAAMKAIMGVHDEI